MKPDDPIAYHPILHAVLLRNGKVVPVRRGGPTPSDIRAPRSFKEARKRGKTLKLAKRRMVKDPVSVVDYFMAQKRVNANPRPWRAPDDRA